MSSILPVTSTNTPQKSKEEIDVQIGASIPVVDGIRNFLSIPVKLLLWNSKVNSGNVSEDTISRMKEYLHAEGLHDVAVHVNQYRPDEIWRRIFTNPHTSTLSKCTLGIGAGLMEQFFVPKLTGFPGDHYNTFSNTVHLFSDDLAIALHECGHAKDYNNRQYPSIYAGLRAASGGIGAIVTLFQEFMASKHAIHYLKQQSDVSAVQHAWKVLTPAFATYVAYYGMSMISSFEEIANKTVSQLQTIVPTIVECQDKIELPEECLESLKIEQEHQVSFDKNCHELINQAADQFEVCSRAANEAEVLWDEFGSALKTYVIAAVVIIGIGHVVGRWMAAKNSAVKDSQPKDTSIETTNEGSKAVVPILV